MVNKIFGLMVFYIIILLLFSCEMKTYTLQNGKTKVPVNPSVYKNKSKFDTSLLKIIDTTVIYERLDDERSLLLRMDTGPETRFYGVYRFYSNGCFNYFTIDRNQSLDSNSFNPEYRGYRGVYFKEDDRIRSDLFAGSNELGWIGKLPGTLTFKGDTLIVYEKLSMLTEVYIKRKLPQGYLDYNANW
jgi:hypothetical protein